LSEARQEIIAGQASQLLLLLFLIEEQRGVED
jgi:hypothetical protein